ncbi:glycosyl transferase family 2 [Adhaeribacter arboris]|uniref:Glycosyl transferase family 2 n=1 Tax=Adhaeribacter arboris TaxID=2072846 RepID=A0A2T2YBI9_9BACT|nr:glycosyltransferase [Adhaeribacter arboris]PSR52885.1 glycosyl transferase family 2 [Adhaeribacter arboris]
MKYLDYSTVTGAANLLLMKEPFRVLIAIITFKRPRGLKHLLKTLQSQEVSDAIQVEILVVDNDCTGETPKIIAELASTASFKLNLVEEPENGIVSARNKAVDFFLQTSFQALVFIDDDEWPSNTTWLQTLVNTQIQTQADIVTSLVHVIAKDSSKKWVEKVLDYGSHIKKNVGPTNRFYTNNLLLMRRVLEVINPAFDIRFAFTGSSDLHFCIKCRQAGFKAVFTPDAPVQEYYPISRSSLRWFFLRGYRAGEGATRATLYEGTFPFAYFYCLAMSGVRFVRGIFNIVIGLTTVDKAIIARSFLQVGSALGTLGGLFGMSYQEYKTIHGS